MSKFYYRLVFKNFPWALCIDLSNKIDDEMNDKLLQQCIESDNEERPGLEKNTYNTRMKDTDEMVTLYNTFKDMCHTFFMNIPKDCMSDNLEKSKGGAYVSYGEKRYDSYWHNHCNRATINAVYYVSVPDDNGTLSVITDDGEEKKIKISEKEIILMPGWLTHKPNPCKDKHPRASINMEFLSDTRAVLKPDNFDIKEYQSWDNKSFILW